MFGERLKLARKRAGMSLQALSGRATPRVSAQAINKYEKGMMMPSSSVLVGLSKALDVSIDFLMSSQVVELSGVEFRKHSKTSAKDRAQAEALVIERLEDYLAIEDILDLKELNDPFAEVRCDVVASVGEIEKKAQDLRRKWKLGNNPIPSITALLENAGVKVIEEKLPERFDGLTCKVKRAGDKPDIEAIIISSQTNIERKRFSLAHEIAHRVIGGVSDSVGVKSEQAMHRFAGAFLAPADHLHQEVGKSRHKIIPHELMHLKRLYGMSAAAMLMRLRNVGILSESSVEYAFRNYAHSWRKDEPFPIEGKEGLGAFEKPVRFESLVYRALAEDMISPVRAAQFLKVSLAKIEEKMRGAHKQ